MGKTAVQTLSLSGVFKQPFAEQAAFFRNKLGALLPSETWKDIQRAQHDVGFMVAGAQSADLLTDFAAAVDRAITEGRSIGEFRKDFGAIVKKHGWQHTGERNWRTRTIYTTNMAVSYSAGRLAQLRAAGFEYAMYKHSGLSQDPRPLHVKWSGMVLPLDDPWWQTHWPPNDWGCKCRVIGIRKPEDAARYGGRLVDEAPDDGVDPLTGTPNGVGEGWDYMPGDTVSHTVASMAAKTTQWEYTLAKAYMQNVPESVRDTLARAYRDLPSVADDTRRYARRILQNLDAEIPPYRTLGLLTEADAALVGELSGVTVDGFDYAIDASSVNHIEGHHGANGTDLLRGQRPVTAEDYASLPGLLNKPDSTRYVGKSKVGLPVVEIVKQFDDGTMVSVWEVRKGRKTVALQSMWIKVSGAPPR